MVTQRAHAYRFRGGHSHKTTIPIAMFLALARIEPATFTRMPALFSGRQARYVDWRRNCQNGRCESSDNEDESCLHFEVGGYLSRLEVGDVLI